MEIIHNRTPESIRSAASRVKIFAARSNRLASRLIRVKEELEKSQIITPQTDLHSKANINLLPVTADDIMEYFELLSDYSPGLVRHLQKYGSDEECFYKWHERLRLIGVAVGVNGIPDIFDLKVDSEDLRHDTFQLRQSIDSITSDVQDQEAIKKMLLSQETIAYKTIPNNDSGVTIKAKMIKYDRLLGKGTDL